MFFINYFQKWKIIIKVDLLLEIFCKFIKVKKIKNKQVLKKTPLMPLLQWEAIKIKQVKL